MPHKKISHMVIMGDSLSDRSTADRDYIFGCIPMSLVTGLKNTSPQGRFTNGYVWADRISALFASDFIISEFKKKHPDYTDEEISDAVISKKGELSEAIRYDYTLESDLYVKFEGKDFIRSYAEGGLSAHDYGWTPSTSLVRFISRIILATLEEKRSKLLAYDEQHQLSRKQKSQTLVVEWSGANDLITVNARPSREEVDKAIKERVKNLEILLKSGYRNFVLFNLPDLSLTPRFQNMQGKNGVTERENAHECVLYFNEELAKACKKMQTMFPHCSFDVFDVHGFFNEAYENPKKYRLDPEKLKQPYKTSPDFKMLPNGTSPSEGYTFWDDIHPTADVHALLANKFYERYNTLYKFAEPDPEEPELHISEKDLHQAFCLRYAEKLAYDRQRFLGSFRGSYFQYQKASLKEILKHAFCEGGARSKEVLAELHWIDQEGKTNLNIPVLKQAMESLKDEVPNLVLA